VPEVFKLAGQAQDLLAALLGLMLLLLEGVAALAADLIQRAELLLEVIDFLLFPANLVGPLLVQCSQLFLKSLLSLESLALLLLRGLVQPADLLVKP